MFFLLFMLINALLGHLSARICGNKEGEILVLSLQAWNTFYFALHDS